MKRVCARPVVPPRSQVELRLVRLKWSMTAAMMMIDPMAVCCQNGFTPRRLRPFRMVTISSTPAAVPRMLPVPPVKAAPPITTAAIASSRSRAPRVAGST